MSELRTKGELKTDQRLYMIVGLGGSGFGKEDPPLNLPKLGWDGRDSQSTAM